MKLHVEPVAMQDSMDWVLVFNFDMNLNEIERHTVLRFGSQLIREVRNETPGFMKFFVVISLLKWNGKNSAGTNAIKKVARQIIFARSRVHKLRVCNGQRT